MKGTRLWQEAGSPLISGRSRREQPLSVDWGIALLVGWLAACAWAVLAAGTDSLAAATEQAPVLAIAFGGSAFGAGIGVGLARQMGWRRRWITGALLGGLFALAAVLVFGDAVSGWSSILKG